MAAKPKILRELDGLPEDALKEVEEFIAFLKKYRQRNREPLITTDYVLAETATLIRMRDKTPSLSNASNPTSACQATSTSRSPAPH